LHWFICGLTKKGLTKKGVRIKVQQFLVLGNFSAKLDIPSQSTNHSRNSVMRRGGGSWSKGVTY
jgi:hypothetical protein